MFTKVCPTCGKEFSTTKRVQKYCCRKCSGIANYEAKKDKLKCKTCSSLMDLTGKKFGKLTVIGLHHIKERFWKGKKVGYSYYHTCRCDCGNEKIINATDLKYGNTKTCGCGRLERVCNLKTHGQTGTRLYKTWKKMKSRCFCKNNPKYNSYGGRGITMCPEWKDDFMAFHDWAYSNGYEEGLTIDRINNDGDYEPSNCRWTTNKVQANNRRSNRFITFNGETHTVSEWADILKVNYSTIRNRLFTGWSIERAFTTPARKQRGGI